MGLISGYQNGLERSLNATKASVLKQLFVSNGKSTKNSSPEPNYHQHPWISQLVWTPNEEYFVGWENLTNLQVWDISQFSPEIKHHQQRIQRSNSLYIRIFFLKKIIRAMKHSKDQHSDRIQGRPTFPNLPTFETSTTAGSLPVCLGCWRWRWHFYSSTTGSGAGGVDVVVSCFGCLKKPLKSDMAHGKSPCLIGNTEIHLQLWWIFHCHVGFSVVYWLECCSNAVFWRILMDWDDSVREFKMIWMISITNNELHVRKCFFHIAFLGFELDVWRGG